jgi:hypothetical protein
MQYDCQDISRILNSDAEDSIDCDLFSDHMANCKACGDLCQLESEFEESLTFSLPKAAPPSLFDDVMSKVRIDESKSGTGHLIERSLPYIGTAIFCAISVVGISKWNEIKILLSSMKLASLQNRALELFRYIDLPDISVSGILSYVGENPLILSVLIAVTVLLWAYSILELERAPEWKKPSSSG